MKTPAGYPPTRHSTQSPHRTAGTQKHSTTSTQHNFKLKSWKQQQEHSSTTTDQGQIRNRFAKQKTREITRAPKPSTQSDRPVPNAKRDCCETVWPLMVGCQAGREVDPEVLGLSEGCGALSRIYVESGEICSRGVLRKTVSHRGEPPSMTSNFGRIYHF